MRYLILLSFMIFIARHAAAQANSCPEAYLRFSKDHSYCKPVNPQCQLQSYYVTPQNIEEILKVHNNYRSVVATGKEVKLPTASDMLQMVWDQELAQVAQQHAFQCVFEHDCSDCRRVYNFGVGQNLAVEYVTNSPDVPPPSWDLAIKGWYDEINYFQKSDINPFKPAPPSAPATGHFTQVVWAKTWRVGCGYVLYKDGDTYTKLYVCNYGPAGNMESESVYQPGQVCSACPVNSCCDKTCATAPDYPGLCKITDNHAPVYKDKRLYYFHCKMENHPDCLMNASSGQEIWTRASTLSGNLLRVFLKGGEESSITFTKKIKPDGSCFCFATKFRKGPNKDGEEDSNKFIEIFKIPSVNYEVKQEVPSFSGDSRHEFNTFSMSLSWNMETEVTLKFSVPPGKPEQFLEISELSAYHGKC